jgi:hypothetical protein
MSDGVFGLDSAAVSKSDIVAPPKTIDEARAQLEDAQHRYNKACQAATGPDGNKASVLSEYHAAAHELGRAKGHCRELALAAHLKADVDTTAAEAARPAPPHTPGALRPKWGTPTHKRGTPPAKV